MDNRTLRVDPHQLLKTHVKEYLPGAYQSYWTVNAKRPVFTQFSVREMLFDPRVNFGLWLIKGPMLSMAEFEVECDNEEVRQFAVDHLNNFWLNGAVQALKAIEWGYSGAEVLYDREEETGRIVYAGLKDFDPPSVKVVTKDGRRTGILIQHFMTTTMSPGKAVYLGGPKCFHHVHWRHVHPYYGLSRLYSAHIPWNEMWSEGGYRDIRRMWFYKNAFEGGILYHPAGYIRDPQGRLIHYQDLAQELIEKKRTGATLTLPSEFHQQGNMRKWEYEPPQGNTIPAGLFDYGDSLRIEILEAMGIPYEVIEASGNEGFGSSSGRQIPETAFYSILQEELNWLLYDYVEQIVKPNIQINAHLGLLPYAPIKVTAFSLNSSGYGEATEEGQFGEEGFDEEGNERFDEEPNRPRDEEKGGEEEEGENPKGKKPNFQSTKANRKAA